MTIEELKALPIESVKALAYDCLVRLETDKQNLNILNHVIAEKAATA
jgi:hypothetical protein